MALSALQLLRNEYIRGAKARDISFFLSHKEFENLVFKNCAYCGSSPSRIIKSSINEIKVNGIDRIDSNGDYVYENCITCCTLCNRLKSDMNRIEFLEHIAKIAKHNIFYLE